MIDAEVIEVLRQHPHGGLTRYIADLLQHNYGVRLPTSQVLARLKRLEKAGKVRRVPSSYRVQIKWALS